MSPRVLVADDSEDMRVLLRMILVGADFTVVGAAADGDEALAMWHEAKHDLFAVILDQRMPGLTGIEVAEQILKERPEQRIVLFSAQLDADLAARAESIGVTACVGKEEVASLPSLAALRPD